MVLLEVPLLLLENADHGMMEDQDQTEFKLQHYLNQISFLNIIKILFIIHIIVKILQMNLHGILVQMV